MKSVVQERLREVMVQNGDEPDLFEFKSSGLEAKIEQKTVKLRKDPEHQGGQLEAILKNEIEKIENNTSNLEAN